METLDNVNEKDEDEIGKEKQYYFVLLLTIGSLIVIFDLKLFMAVFSTFFLLFIYVSFVFRQKKGRKCVNSFLKPTEPLQFTPPHSFIFNRPNEELFLSLQFEKTTTPSLFVFGEKGCGKTTLVRKCISERQEKNGAVYCDVTQYPEAYGAFRLALALADSFNLDILKHLRKEAKGTNHSLLVKKINSLLLRLLDCKNPKKGHKKPTSLDSLLHFRTLVSSGSGLDFGEPSLLCLEYVFSMIEHFAVEFSNSHHTKKIPLLVIDSLETIPGAASGSLLVESLVKFVERMSRTQTINFVLVVGDNNQFQYNAQALFLRLASSDDAMSLTKIYIPDLSEFQTLAFFAPHHIPFDPNPIYKYVGGRLTHLHHFLNLVVSTRKSNPPLDELLCSLANEIIRRRLKPLLEYSVCSDQSADDDKLSKEKAALLQTLFLVIDCSIVDKTKVRPFLAEILCSFGLIKPTPEDNAFSLTSTLLKNALSGYVGVSGSEKRKAFIQKHNDLVFRDRRNSLLAQNSKN